MTQTDISPGKMNKWPSSTETMLNIQAIRGVQVRPLTHSAGWLQLLWRCGEMVTLPWFLQLRDVKWCRHRKKKVISSENQHKMKYKPAVSLSYLSMSYGLAFCRCPVRESSETEVGTASTIHHPRQVDRSTTCAHAQKTVFVLKFTHSATQMNGKHISEKSLTYRANIAEQLTDEKSITSKSERRVASGVLVVGKGGMWVCRLIWSDFMEHWPQSVHTSHWVFTLATEYSHRPLRIHTSHGKICTSYGQYFTLAMKKSQQP